MVAWKSISVLFILGFVIAVTADRPEEPTISSERGEDEEKRGGVRPTCNQRGDTVTCCIGISVKGHPLNSCVELAIVPNQMKAVATLKVNDHNVVSKDASVGKACAPLPAPLSMLQACLHVYYANVNVNNKYADVCFVFEVTHVLQVSFDCFRLGKGQFQHHSEHPPEKHGLINVGWAHGKPTFHLNMPGK